MLFSVLSSSFVSFRVSQLRLSSHTPLSSAASLMAYRTLQDYTKRKLSYEQIATYGLVAAGTNAVVSTIIATYYADLVRKTNPNA